MLSLAFITWPSFSTLHEHGCNTICHVLDFILMIKPAASIWHVTLVTELKELSENHESQLAQLTSKHGRKVSYIHKLLHTSSAYKRNRKPDLMNAIIHHKAQELNDGKWPYL